MGFSIASAQAHRVIQLRGPASQAFVLEGAGRKTLAWEAEDRQQCELEIRARIVGNSGALGTIPVVRWFAETSHGESVWREPASPLAIIAGTVGVDYSVPARGMLFRTNTREFRLTFYNQGLVGGAPLERSELWLSFLPGVSQRTPLYPYAHNPDVVPATIQHMFPIEAREWKIRSTSGVLPNPAGAVVYIGLNGALIGPVPFTDLTEWQPIPHEAAAWLPSVPGVYGYYR